MEKNLNNIINESLLNEVRVAILEEKENGKKVFHITCEGEPVQTCYSEDEAHRHLDIYKKEHPEKEFIIEKTTYNSYSEMIDKLEELGEKLEVNETKTMEKKSIKVKNGAQAVLDAKEKGLKEFKIGTETINVDEAWKQLEELESQCEECGQKMEENSEVDESAFVLAADAAKDAGKKEFEFPKGSGKMHKVTIKQDIPEESDTNEGFTMFMSAIISDYRKKHGRDPSDEELGKELKKIYGEPEKDEDKKDDKKKKDVKEGHGSCNECGAMLTKEDVCNECGAPMNESKKSKLRLTESELVSLISKIVNESVPGLEVTKKAQKISGSDSKSHMADVEKKLKGISSFDGNDNPEFPKAIGKGDTAAERTTEEENETIDDFRGGGLEDLNYGYEPSKRFKARLKKALEGDSTMGNSQDAANVIKSDLGEKIGKKIERKAKKIAKEPEVSWGHSWKEPEKVNVVKESEKPKMSSILEEEIKRMKNILGYDERTQ